MYRNAGPCRQCGAPKNRLSQAVYCFPCAKERYASRIAAPGRVRAGLFTPTPHPAGGWACVECAEPVKQSVQGGKKRRPPLRCEACRWARWVYLDLLSGKSGAASAVALARRKGQLSAPTDHACTDCNAPAECYDHRDYNEPLRVEPVCRSCNVMRGPALPFNPYLVGLLLIAAEPKQQEAGA